MNCEEKISVAFPTFSSFLFLRLRGVGRGMARQKFEAGKSGAGGTEGGSWRGGVVVVVMGDDERVVMGRAGRPGIAPC